MNTLGSTLLHIDATARSARRATFACEPAAEYSATNAALRHLSHLLLFVVLGCTGAARAQAVLDRSLPDFAAPAMRDASVVVSISTTRQPQSAELGFLPDSFAVPVQLAEAPRDPWPRARRSDQERGLASGIVISSDGEVLTNAHAVADVDRVIVRLADGRQFVANVTGLDRTTDIALLKIEAHGLASASIGSTSRLTAGEWVFAIGSPFGLDNSVTAGVVSASPRFLPGSAVPLIQTDVAINPGSSGGPLLNLRGEVIGVNSMGFTISGGSMGVSFSVPIELALKIAQELRSSGSVSRGQLGAKIQEVTPELARSFGLQKTAGVLVLRVVRASPAERGGLRRGDIILGCGANTAASYVQIQQEVAQARPGQRLSVNVWRRGSVLRLDLIVAEALPDLPARPERVSANRHDPRLGLNLGELSSSRRDSLGLDAGIPVLEAHGAASRGGVLADDVIVAVADRLIHDLAEFDAALAAVPAERSLIPLLVLRGVSLAYITVELAH